MRALRLCLVVSLAAFQTLNMKRNSSNDQNPAQRPTQKQQRINRAVNPGVENEQPSKNEALQQQNNLEQYNMANSYNYNPYLPTQPTHPFPYPIQQLMPLL